MNGVVTRAVYIPPFAKARRMGHPSFCGWFGGEGWARGDSRRGGGAIWCFFCCWGVEEGLALVATEGDEVELLGLLEAFQAGWHGGTSSLHPTLRKVPRRMGHPSFCGWLGVEGWAPGDSHLNEMTLR